MDDELSSQLDLRDTPEILFQNCRFDFELMLVAGMLIVTAAAGAKVRAVWLNTIRRSLQNPLRPRSGKSALFFKQRGFYLFAFQNKGNEHRFAAPVFIGSQAGETIPAINKFFNSELQAMILTTPRERLHVKQTEPRQAILFQQAFANILFLQLFNLYRGHFAAVRS